MARRDRRRAARGGKRGKGVDHHAAPRAVAHAARCDVCLSEADMAYEMQRDGKSLDDIRTAIDRLYET